MEEFNAYVEANAERFIEELKEFCRQPSIAAQGIGLEEMGQLVRARLEKLGAEVRSMPVNDGPPVIYAELGQGQRTLLLYNHYDVQPHDPLDLWDSERFDPRCRRGHSTPGAWPTTKGTRWPACRPSRPTRPLWES